MGKSQQESHTDVVKKISDAKLTNCGRFRSPEIFRRFSQSGAPLKRSALSGENKPARKIVYTVRFINDNPCKYLSERGM